ncbi:uncharacterized protein LOC119585559, partial [Penaeus monodon]|uniref:uncharacterized protein LOC119585559 n=1 Tax=Penaeus monodon TaxID=6687 RepID=UPI0018A7287F
RRLRHEPTLKEESGTASSPPVSWTTPTSLLLLHALLTNAGPVRPHVLVPRPGKRVLRRIPVVFCVSTKGAMEKLQTKRPSPEAGHSQIQRIEGLLNDPVSVSSICKLPWVT